MGTYKILTDSCCDFAAEQYRQLGLEKVTLSMEFRGQILPDRNDDSLKEIYDAMRGGESPKTAAVNPRQWAEAMEAVLEKGEDLLVMVFSSGLSATYQAAVIAAEEMGEKYPQRKIRVVDTLCASMGQGLLVWYACRKREGGMALEELAAWVEENKGHLCHWFTVDDLMHLKRGGRVSAATALVGTMLQIKPLLHVDDEGHLIKVSTARGRKASIQALARKAKELGEGFDNRTMFISHGDCLEDARYLEELVKQECGVEQVITNYVGAVIGSHAGPGTLALSLEKTDERQERHNAAPDFSA